MNKENQLVEQKDIYEAAELIGKTFIQRRDTFASQLYDGRYVSVKEPLTTRHLALHLQGNITVGAYILAPDSRTRFMVFDADGDDDIVVLANLSRTLKEKGIPTYLETSRRGGHLWFFFSRPIEGEQVRMFGKVIMAETNLSNIELFPKQDRLGSGPGSLVRLPFGRHRLTGTRYPFILPSGEMLALSVREQIHILSAHQTVPDELFDQYVTYASQTSKKAFKSPTGEIFDPARLERIKAVPAINFIGLFVDLKPTPSGAVGKCPFHNDTHPSFGVNSKDNYWHCFAGCGGGSIIDFWMKWRNIDFPQAVDELGNLFGES